MDRFGNGVIEAYLTAPKSRATADLSLESSLNEAQAALLDWHNKQIEAVLERLGVQIDYNKHDFGDMGEFIRIKYVDNLIEAERNKLKESTDD